ncbi:MAG: hypothetical protein LBQ52_08300 [Helicobacteraceae bacterium]|jgi:spermidine synthase|nr:hypothetical protein [Helicobacteraceae bacterium]
MKKIMAETAAHIPLCVIDKPRSTLVLGEGVGGNLLDEIAKHKTTITVCSLRGADFDYDENAIVWKSGSIATNAESLNAKYDAIIDLRGQKPNNDEAKTLLTKLSEGGVLLKAFGALDSERLKAYQSCRFVIPCALSAFAPLDGAINGYIFASKKPHPTADLKLQKADMLDDLDYYSVETHNAAFAIPPFIFAQFGELIKN